MMNGGGSSSPANESPQPFLIAPRVVTVGLNLVSIVRFPSSIFNLFLLCTVNHTITRAYLGIVFNQAWEILSL